MHLYMKQTQQQLPDEGRTDDPAPPPSSSAVLLLLKTVADTTLRLFVPSVGGTVIGLIIDNVYGTKPWGTVIGVTGGTLLAFGLVYMQVKKINRESNR